MSTLMKILIKDPACILFNVFSASRPGELACTLSRAEAFQF